MSPEGPVGFAIARAQRYPRLRCTVADLPVVCELAEELIAHYGVQDQVDTLPLNMFFEAWPTGYDAMFSAPELRAALEREGFREVAVQNTYGYFSLVSARRP
jgi:hypothetical protein